MCIKMKNKTMKMPIYPLPGHFNFYSSAMSSSKETDKLSVEKEQHATS